MRGRDPRDRPAPRRVGDKPSPVKEAIFKGGGFAFVLADNWDPGVDASLAAQEVKL